MYLKTIAVENAGPITSLRIELPFRDGLPLPLVLVGPNGSGKSTLLSFIVNALVGFKQQAFEQAEIEHDRVYRVRSQMFMRRGTCWYHAKLEFEEGLSLDEWMLDRPRKAFEAEVSPLPADAGWKQINEDESDLFQLTPQPGHPISRVPSKPIQKLFGENVVLFFPSDRFELPDWLNERSLAVDLRFPEPVMFKGQTARRIFSRALLRPTLEWIKAVTLDSRLSDYELCTIQVGTGNGVTTVPGLVARGGRDSRIVEFIGKVLARILDADSDRVQFLFSHRNMGTIAAAFHRSGRAETVPNLLGLSAGQAALFCVFSNVIRDFDLAGAQLNDVSDIRGIVILDEADLHLHVDLQYRILPELMKTFPRVQFIVTAHAPLLVVGMEKAFGEDGFRVIDMPAGESIETEAFSEFGHALAAFTRTRAFDQRLLDHIQRAARPVVIVEGKTDVTHLQTAWEKLNRGLMPWDIVPCGGFSTKESRGGADMLRTMLRACCLHLERTALGLFDHDREGVEQFDSLKSDGFEEATERTHWKHSKQPVHSLLLPVPLGREKFVSPKAKSCFLTIEHYYSDALLNRFGVADEPVVADSAVFGITGDSRKKTRFAEALPSLDKSEFVNFGLLFDRLAQVLGTQGDQASDSVPATCASLPQTFDSNDPGHQMTVGFQFPPNVMSASDLEPAGPVLGPEVVRPDTEGVNETTQEKND
jgi:energy-coupling factor transporter ATP-binding protein EcfA2